MNARKNISEPRIILSDTTAEGAWVVEYRVRDLS